MRSRTPAGTAALPEPVRAAKIGQAFGEWLGWFDGQLRWRYVMRLRSDTWIHGTGAPLGGEVRKLQLQRGQCRGFWNVQLWADRSRSANLVLASPTGLPVEEPWYLVSNLNPSLDLVWTYGQRFCCEQLFRDQKSGIFQLESSGLRRRVDPHWKRGMSLLRIGLSWLQQCASNAGCCLLAWSPIPRRQLSSPASPAAASIGAANSPGSPTSTYCHNHATAHRWLSHDRLT